MTQGILSDVFGPILEADVVSVFEAWTLCEYSGSLSDEEWMVAFGPWLEKVKGGSDSRWYRSTGITGGVKVGWLQQVCFGVDCLSELHGDPPTVAYWRRYLFCLRILIPRFPTWVGPSTGDVVGQLLTDSRRWFWTIGPGS